jgi:hypothetical protein
MHTVVRFCVLFGSVLVGAAPACAEDLTIMDIKPVSYNDISSQPIEQPWASPRPSSQLVERPLADIISTKLGIAKGSVELFSYRLQNAPSNATVLDGVVGGAGIKLKLTW